MQIPKEVTRPDKTTMMVVADTQTAKLYIIKGDEINEIKEIFFPEERATDKEGGFAQHGASGEVQSFGNPPVMPDEDHLLKDHLCTSLNDELFTRFQNKEFEKWFLVAPDYIIKTVQDSMHSYLQESLDKTLAQNLVNEHPLEILQKIYK